MCTENKLEISICTPSIKSVLTIVKEKLRKLIRKFNVNKQKNPTILCDPNVKSYVETLHKRYAVVTIAKS